MAALSYIKIPLTAAQVAEYNVPRNRGLIDTDDNTLALIVLPDALSTTIEPLGDGGVEYGAGGPFVTTTNEQRSFSISTVESRADVVSLLRDIKATAEQQSGIQSLIEVRDYIHPTKSDRESQGYTVRYCIMTLTEAGASILQSRMPTSDRYNVGGLEVEFTEVNAATNPGYTAASWA